MKITVIKDGKVVDKDFDMKELIDEVVKTINESPEDFDKEFEEDMDFFDKNSEQSYAIYAGLIAVNYFLKTGEELVEKSENFTEKDFEYGVKILNACMERKAKEVGGKYTLVIKPLEEE